MNLPTQPHSSGPLRILVVENHADTSKYLCLYLEQIGHSVRRAATVREALTILAAETPDILISDVGLPDGTGWELLEKASLPPAVYAIAMSGFGMGKDRSRSKDAGFRHHLVKPFSPEMLDEHLAEAARERSRQ